MEYIESPTEKDDYTPTDLREYAYHRKIAEMHCIEEIFKDKKVVEGDMPVEEHAEYREPLAFSKEIVVIIELSTGGDADGIKLTFNEQNELIRGVYYWADWGVYEEVRLSEEELEMVDRLYSVSDWLAGS